MAGARGETTSDAPGDLPDLRGAFGDATADFLHMEFEHLHAAYLSNEEGGEKRVNVLLALIAATTAALGVGFDDWSAAGLPSAVLAASLVLLAYGLVTLRRLMGRNVHTTELLNGLRRVRAAFLWTHPEALLALPFVPGGDPMSRARKDGLGRAGFLEVVAVTNCLLAAVAAYLTTRLFVSGSDPEVLALATIALATAAVAWFAQMWWTRRIYAEGEERNASTRTAALNWWTGELERMRSNTFRAGVGLVVTDGAGRVLAYERADVRGAWQLPQGGIDDGEAPEDAAWRELREETGLGRDDVEMVRAFDAWLAYELPDEMRSKKTGRGQAHRWFVFRLRDGAALPPLDDADDEFADRRWTTLDELASTAVDFRRPVYRILARELDLSS